MSLQNSAQLLIANGPCLEVPIAFITASRAPLGRKPARKVSWHFERPVSQTGTHLYTQARENTGSRSPVAPNVRDTERASPPGRAADFLTSLLVNLSFLRRIYTVHS